MSLIQFLWKNYLRLTHPSCTIKAASLSRNVRLENNVVLGYGSHVQASKIGKYTYINKYCLIDKNTISIGRFCSIAYNVRIGLGSHPGDWVSTHQFAYDPKYKFTKQAKKFGDKSNHHTIIGHDVWIGANATVLAGVTIGDGAIIGAHSLVTKDVRPYSIVMGTPAEHHRYRFDLETSKALQKIQWWNWDDKRIKENIDLFDSPERLVKNVD